MDLTISFTGNLADSNQVDFYDVAQALIGFQRTLALTTHLLLNGEVITQAPALKGAEILALPPVHGSWQFNSKVVFNAALAMGVYHIGTAPQDTPIGHLAFSAYDYVISESLGFHIDYDTSLGESYEALNRQEGSKLPILQQSQFDSVIEKCEASIKNMHRPIVASGSADKATIFWTKERETIKTSTPLDSNTYQYIAQTHQDDSPELISGKVSSYNINTFNGRIFVPELKRPIPFYLAESARTYTVTDAILASMNMNSRERFGKGPDAGSITLVGYKNTSTNGRLKSFRVVAKQ